MPASGPMDARSTFAGSRTFWLHSRDANANARPRAITGDFFFQLALVCLAYVVAGKLGQATSHVRSDYVGPVWPAHGVALAGALAFGYRIWPALLVGAFVTAYHGAVTPLTALGQATGAALAGAAGAWLLHRLPQFDPKLPRLRDALGLIILGGFASALVSSTIGISSLYLAGIQAYSGLLPG